MPTMTSTDTISVPFVDLRPMHEALKAPLLEAFGELIDAGAFTMGPEVRAFEEAYASYCDAADCVGLGSGLDALRLGLLALGVEGGAEVVVPAATFVATFEAVTQAGGTPVVVDVDESSYGMDAGAAAAAITSKTAALLPVHLYGQLADMRALARLSDRVPILEDACQAHGARREGIRPGELSAAAAYSFYPAKNLGAFGDAGALTTGDEELAERVRALREHGQVAKYRHRYDGYTARLDTLQAIVLREKVHHLDRWTAQRRDVARVYSDTLEGIGDLRLPPVAPDSEPVWHLYVVRTAEPDELAGFLRERGIGTGRHYPEPPHLSEAWAWLGHKPGSFPVAEALSRECLSLPLFPGMTDAQVEKTVAAVSSYFDG
jgi:dTDP-3-amino-3,4,6-trideoxy-alpha-D-glucose transaminase